jgi:hypothetical protein
MSAATAKNPARSDSTMQALLVFVVLVAGSVWVGGLVTVAVVVRTVEHCLDAAGAVEFFAVFGRSYGVVSGTALLVAMAGGLVLLADHGWDATAVATAVLAASLPFVTAIGVVQARRMTMLRRLAVTDPADADLARTIHAGAARAVALRATIGVITLATVFLAAVLAT